MRSKTSKSTGQKRKPPKRPAVPTLDLTRVTEVFLWIVQGQTEGHIVEAIAAKWPDQDSRPLIVAALQQVEKAGDVNARLTKGWCIEAYRELHRRLVEMGDYAAAVRAVAKINEISSSAPPEPDGPNNEQQESEAEAQARAHLAPLFDDGESLPLAELARLAAHRILSQ